MGQPVKSFSETQYMHSKELQDLIHYIETKIYEDTPFKEITPEIFIYGGLEYTDSLLYKVVNNFLNTSVIDNIHDEIGEQHINTIEVVNQSKIVPMSKELISIFNNSGIEASITTSNYIGSDHILLTVLKGDTISYFRNYGLNYKIALKISKELHSAIETINNVLDDDSEEFNNGDNSTQTQISFTILNNDKPQKNTVINEQTKKPVPFCTNMNAQAKIGKYGKTIGRKEEIDQIFKVLGRHKTNNVVLVGNSGVGKTQIVRGIANLLKDSEVPFFFKGKELYEFNYGEIISGTQFRGMLEERMLGMFRVLKSKKNAILFIDNIDNIFSERHSDEYNTGGEFETLFEDGDVQVISCCDYKGYKALTDSNPSIAKKLQKITIKTPSFEECRHIVNGVKEEYGKFHKVIYSDEIIDKAIDLCGRYVTEKSMPSSVIEIIDELGSYSKINQNKVVELRNKNIEKNKIINEKNDAIVKNDGQLVEQLTDKLSQINKEIAIDNSSLLNMDTINVTIDDLYKVVSEHTSVPVGKLKSNDKKALNGIEDVLKSKIIGQDEAINVVSKAIKRNKIGLSNPNRPQLSALFVGESGVGKSMLAKQLAKEIFGDEHYLVRFDMSEYSDETSVNKLIGASAGYVGYSEGGLLTEAVKNNKYCVLLIDEIEKANPKIYNLFLQILDDGHATDNTGKKVDFKNTMIIMTSNVGTKEANRSHALGFDVNDDVNKREIIEKELKNKFPPEFINRIDNIVYFNRLTEDNLKEIIKLELKYFIERLNKIGYDLKYSDGVIEMLYETVENDREYGARPIKRAICDLIENIVTDLIIQNDYENYTFNVTIENDKIKID